MTYLLTLVTFFSIGIILAMSLNLLMGYTGQVSMAHGGFMAIGAYTAAWFAINLELNMVWAMLVAGVGAGLVGWLFALATARISGDEFVLASFALQMVIIEAISRWTSVTRGTYGLSGVPKPEIFGERLRTIEQFSVFTVIVMLLCALVLMRLGGSTFGLVLRGLRESVPSMQALGRDTTRFKIVVMVVACAFAGIAGALQASMVTFLHPDSFTIMLSIIIVAYLLVGGLGNMWGAALGAVLLLSVPELIATTEIIPTNLLGPMERVLYGVILMLFVWFRPRGIIAERRVLDVGRMIRRGTVTVPTADAGLDQAGAVR